MPEALPLAGVRVLSLAEQLPGPICGLLLAELGAEVTLLERPDGGDPQRQVGPWNFRFAGRGKRSVALDLKDQVSLAAARRLAASAHILIEGFRPGVLDRLGLGYEAVSATNPAIVYCSISGYGSTGPFAQAAGHNLNYEAMSGMLAPFVTGAAKEYFLEAPPWGDITSGMLAALGVVAALRMAESTSQGSRLDLSITDSLVFALGPALSRHLNGAEAFPRREGAYGIFRCSDGHVVLGINHEDHMWRALCRELSLEGYASLDHEERLRRRSEIREAIQDAMLTRPVEHWVRELSEVAACSPVNTLDAVVGDEQLRTRGIFTEATTEAGSTFVTVQSPLGHRYVKGSRVPQLGEHTASVLAGVGVTEQEIDQILQHNQRFAS
ncbi:CaiB/BaiF CoA transferase family protein [Streptosporangium sp. NPDC087985]|uniref:CaiB/BaiF CoA transferase family protein n=1 Tax=Streptosporangium sp. NPDC087985 TaxID=3366196 RepID=UPI00380E3141